MKKHYEKLIRDRIPEIMDQAGVTYEVRTLDGKEYAEALRQKLVEEAQEAAKAASADLTNEIADLLEVIHALVELEGIDLRDVENVRHVRGEERGAFGQRRFLEWTEEPTAPTPPPTDPETRS